MVATNAKTAYVLPKPRAAHQSSIAATTDESPTGAEAKRLIEVLSSTNPIMSNAAVPTFKDR
jgi:hypothetical protein